MNSTKSMLLIMKIHAKMLKDLEDLLGYPNITPKNPDVVRPARAYLLVKRKRPNVGSTQDFKCSPGEGPAYYDATDSSDGILITVSDGQTSSSVWENFTDIKKFFKVDSTSFFNILFADSREELPSSSPIESNNIFDYSIVE